MTSVSQSQSGEPEPRPGEGPSNPHAEPTEIAHPQAPPSFVKDGPSRSVPPVPPPPNAPPPPAYGWPPAHGHAPAPQPPNVPQPPNAPPPYGQPTAYARPPAYGQQPPPQPPYGGPGYGQPPTRPGGWPSGQSAAGYPGTAPFTQPGYAPPPGGGSGNRRALVIGVVAAVVAIAAVVTAVVLLSSGGDDKEPVSHGTVTATGSPTSSRPSPPSGPIPGTSRPPTAAPTATGSETVRKMNQDDCIDSTLTPDGNLPETAGMVPCDAGNALVRITSAIKKSSGRTIAECAKTDGSVGWDIPQDPDNFYCVERVYHSGECFPATATEPQLGLVVPCSPSSAQEPGGKVVRIVQVFESLSATCAGDYRPLSLPTRTTMLCTEDL
jgi:hypothetical protein